MPTSTFGLLERVRTGDQQAFTELFRKYSPRLAVLVHYRMSPDLHARIEVDDILQETFLAATRQLAKFEYRNAGSFMSWLSRIADHVIVDAARHHGRRKRKPPEMVPLRSESNPAGAEAVDSVTPSRVFARKERVQRVLRKLDALPEDYRKVILLAKMAGLSTQEIAERLGRSKLNVAVLLHRAVQRLRELDAASESR
ncbi:MAG: sigma-70 family RNA polymerase sigma factor [Acidobacteria bacterium]|nr:sigma-70 family RNA polymerase sigma factor [Acidobacteriota bacterium]